MSNTEKGVLIFSEWFEAMKKLNPNEFKKLMLAIYDFQMKGIEPPEFYGKTALVADMIFPYIRRRVAAAEAAKKASENRAKQFCDNPIVNDLLRKRAAK